MCFQCLPYPDGMSDTDLSTIIIGVLTALGTIGAVVAAVFHNSIDNYFNRARIEVKLADPDGELTSWTPIPPIVPASPGPAIPQGLSGTSGTAPASGTSGYSGPVVSPGSAGTSGTAFASRTFGYSGNTVPPGSSGTSGNAPSSGTFGFSGSAVTYYHLRVIRDNNYAKVKECRVSLVGLSIKRQVDGAIYDPLTLIVPPNYYWAPSESQPQAIDIVTERILDFGYFVYNIDHFIPTVWPLFNNFQGYLHPNTIIKYEIEIVAENIKPQRYYIITHWDGTWDHITHKPTNFSIQEPVLIKQ